PHLASFLLAQFSLGLLIREGFLRGCPFLEEARKTGAGRRLVLRESGFHVWGARRGATRRGAARVGGFLCKFECHSTLLCTPRFPKVSRIAINCTMLLERD